jgi:hypothetical protein
VVGRIIEIQRTKCKMQNDNAKMKSEGECG